MLKITKVKRNCIASELGLEVGDEIVAFDGHPCEDELDYLYYNAAESFTMTVRDKREKREVTLEIEKDEEEELGFAFEKPCSIRTCRNRCVFCFVDQMPKGMRESLYIKDDDYGMSFTCGNFVTLTNLSDEGLKRIIRLRLSPLYISVHTMNPNLRVELLRNRFAGKIVEQIKRLAEAGIEMHCQAVVVPNKNDGEEFAYTARELFKYYPAVRDLACVPTGITKHREGLYPIPDIDKAYSESFLDLVDKLNQEFGVNFVQPADEYFVKAERKLKDPSFYGDFEQIENGIGMSAKFRDEFFTALRALPPKQGEKFKLKKPKRSLLVSGVSSAKLNADLVQIANETIEGLNLVCLPVENEFFGKTVTCTGLLTGVDMLAAIKAYQAENPDTAVDEIILDGNTMKEFEEVFLCGTTLKELKRKLKFENIRVNREGGYGLVEILSTSAK